MIELPQTEMFVGEGDALSLGEMLRDHGTARVLSNNEAYRSAFFCAAETVLSEQGEVTSEQVVERIGMPSGHSNAVGASMRAFAVSRGLSVDRYEKSTRPKCHAAIIAVWKQ